MQSHMPWVWPHNIGEEWQALQGSALGLHQKSIAHCALKFGLADEEFCIHSRMWHSAAVTTPGSAGLSRLWATGLNCC